MTNNIFIKENKQFTTGFVGCFIRMPLTTENFAMANLLSRVQFNNSEEFSSIPEQIQVLTRLYNLDLSIAPQLFGNEIILSYTAEFIEPTEVMDPDYTYEQILHVFSSIVQHPNFNANIVDFCKAQIHSDYQELLDSPADYAIEKFFKYWYVDRPDYAQGYLGSLDEIDKTQPEDLKLFFRAIKHFPATILASTRNISLVQKLIEQEFTSFDLSKDFRVNDLVIRTAPIDLDERIENKHSNQANLLLGYHNTKESTFQDKMTSFVLEQYLAGDESSILFRQVREELGAAYAIDAASYPNNSLILISAGIDHKKVQKVKNIVANEIEKIQNGEIDLSLLKKARKAVIRTYLIRLDRQQVQIMYRLTHLLIGSPIEDRVEYIKKVSPAQLKKVAKGLVLKESYCLK